VTSRNPYEHAFEFDEQLLADARASLLAWFAAEGRDLPWRRTRDPWSILVSEVMLQQIQVKRAIPFYESFLARFPTVGSLARAPLSEAILIWRDLGRYRRVVHLHRTARIIVDEHDGVIPSDPATLETLPGIGPYTAGAVACFAHERDVVFADTNAQRVLHRAFLGPDVPEPVAPEGELLQLASLLLPPGEGWTWNQALIELGALVCSARAPRCGSCPLQEHCASRPTILGLIAAERPAERPSPAYEGSNRFYRGRVLAALRDNPPDGLSLRTLANTVPCPPENSPTSMDRMREVVASLRKDGLVEVVARAESLAEERAAYGDDARPEADEDLHVKLP
jgi:A/G-specific adenine glycosylase